MPVPVKAKGEKRDPFVSRCISDLSKKDPNRPHDQIVAICMSQSRKKSAANALRQFSNALKGLAFTKEQWEAPTTLADHEYARVCLINENGQSFLPVRKSPGAPINTNALLDASDKLLNNKLINVSKSAKVEARARLRKLFKEVNMESPEDL